MDREKIELLLAAYVSGEIAVKDKPVLEKLFEQDPALKAEADEMTALWQSLDKLEKAATPPEAMRNSFYEMLNHEGAQPASAKIVALKRPWLQVAAAIVAGVIIFAAGRYTVSPVKIPVVEYKTVYIKQQVPVQQPAAATVFVPAKPLVAVAATAKPIKEKAEPAKDDALAQQLRSIYASERIDAVTKIGAKPQLSDNDLKNLELALKEDPSPNVRLMILDALRPMIAKQNVQAVLINSLSKQDDGMIKTSMVDMLISVRSPQAIPQMIALLNDKETDPVTQNKIKVNIQSFLN